MIFSVDNPASRMSYALAVAIVAHAVILLGVSFSGPDAPAQPVTPPLEIVLTTSQLPAERVEDAEYMGRDDQRGAGNTMEDVAPVLETEPPRLSTADAEGDAADPEPAPAAGTEFRDLIASPGDSRQQTPLDMQNERPTLSAGSRQVLTLAPVARSDDLRERFLTVNTRQTLFADYLSAWKDKVERIGTVNFPGEARRLWLEGSPVLEVALRSDGEIEEIIVRESSGQPALDEAAMRILRLASPFDPFPKDLRDHYSILRFAYEWRFLEGQKLPAGVRDEQP
jgi:protein TonB